MSTAVDIPRASSESAASSSGSPSGLYIPVHKRNALAPDPDSPSPRLNSRSPAHSRRGASPSAQPARSSAPTSAVVPRAPSLIPAHFKIPNVYTIADLLALSSSPLARISSQQEHIQRNFPYIAASIARAPVPDQSSARRRRPGRKSSGSKKLASNVGEGVESRRRRHGAWGQWQFATEGDTLQAEEGWRHAREVDVSA